MNRSSNFKYTFSLRFAGLNLTRMFALVNFIHVLLERFFHTNVHSKPNSKQRKDAQNTFGQKMRAHKMLMKLTPCQSIVNYKQNIKFFLDREVFKFVLMTFSFIR